MSAGQPEVNGHFDEKIIDYFTKVTSELTWPLFGHNAEMQSLLYHARRRDGLETRSVSTSVHNYMLNTFNSVEWMIRSDFLSYDHFCSVLHEVDMTSSPGYPYLLNSPTNALYFKVVDGEIPEHVKRDVYDQVMIKIKQRIADPIRLFIKPEPITKKKFDNSAFRLISSVSVLDQLIDAMLFSDFNARVIANFVRLPTKVGWTQFKGGYSMIHGDLAIDKSSWDWTVMPWLPQYVLKLREDLCLNLNDEWSSLARWRYQCLYGCSVFVTSGGLMFRQKQPGVMKSGSFNTIIDNSIMQVLLHACICEDMGTPVTYLIAMGDDTLQNSNGDDETYLSLLSRYCIVKQAEKTPDFCGFSFRFPYVEPLYIAKHMYKLKHLDPKVEAEVVNAYSLLYHRSKYRYVMRDILSNLGHRLPSIQFLDSIYAHEE